jgi:hypothetical protein
MPTTVNGTADDAGTIESAGTAAPAAAVDGATVLRYNRAQVYAGVGRLEEAVADYLAVIEQDPNYPEYHGRVQFGLPTRPRGRRCEVGNRPVQLSLLKRSARSDPTSARCVQFAPLRLSGT